MHYELPGIYKTAILLRQKDKNREKCAIIKEYILNHLNNKESDDVDTIEGDDGVDWFQKGCIWIYF